MDFNAIPGNLDLSLSLVQKIREIMLLLWSMMGLLIFCGVQGTYNLVKEKINQSQTPTCHKCQKSTIRNAKFCPFCGERLSV